MESERNPTVTQHPDGYWYWLDETWNYGDGEHHRSKQAACSAQARYVSWLETGVTAMPSGYCSVCEVLWWDYATCDTWCDRGEPKALVPLDSVLEAAFRIGGEVAFYAALRERKISNRKT